MTIERQCCVPAVSVKNEHLFAGGIEFGAAALGSCAPMTINESAGCQRHMSPQIAIQQKGEARLDNIKHICGTRT